MAAPTSNPPDPVEDADLQKRVCEAARFAGLEYEAAVRELREKHEQRLKRVPGKTEDLVFTE